MDISDVWALVAGIGVVLIVGGLFASIVLLASLIPFPGNLIGGSLAIGLLLVALAFGREVIRNG